MFNDKSNIETDIIDAIEQYPAVLVGYFFGSASHGQGGPLSDIDVGILLEPMASAAMFGQIQDALCRKLKTDKIDLISLKKAPFSLSYRIIKDGKCIYCCDEKVRERFETDTIMRYLDFKPIRDIAFEVSRKHILEAV